jgi:hypothetical protein
MDTVTPLGCEVRNKRRVVREEALDIVEAAQDGM